MFNVTLRVLLLLSRNDPEVAHDWVMKQLKRVEHSGLLLRQLQHRKHTNKLLRQQLRGIRFPGPVGLAAGFDKNAIAPRALGTVFDFLEIGAVLPRVQYGNARPRIQRLRHEYGLINTMGFNSDGAKKIKQRLRGAAPVGVPIGINLGKMRSTSTQNAADDYSKVLHLLYHNADYFVLNVSSPNTPGLRDLQRQEHLPELLRRLKADISELAGLAVPKPLLVKLSPDITEEEYADVLDTLVEEDADGVVLSNTAITEGNGMTGGYSGPLLFLRSVEMVEYAAKRLAPDKIIIGCGGITSGQRAFKMIKAGADLVQVYTAVIYQGPSVVNEIRADLVKAMKREKVTYLGELSGRHPSTFYKNQN